MKNLFLTLSMILFLGSFAFAQKNSCSLNMSVTNKYYKNNCAKYCFTFTANTFGQDLDISATGHPQWEGTGSYSKEFCYTVIPNTSYNVLIECETACRKDGCVVTIEPAAHPSYCNN